MADRLPDPRIAAVRARVKRRLRRAGCTFDPNIPTERLIDMTLTMKRKRKQTLGGGTLHLFVTRNATLAYQHFTRGGFEAARRALTVRLMEASPDPETPNAYLLDLHGDGKVWLRAYVTRDDPLLVVPKIEIVHGPLA